MVTHSILVQQKTMSHHSQKELLPPRGIGPVKVQDVNENDVLCGRGARIYGLAGNVQMRRLAQGMRHQYLNETTDRFEKLVIADQLVRKIRLMDPPGRFLKQDASSDEWWDIGDVQARIKVAQALRESTPETGLEPGTTSPNSVALPGQPAPISPNSDHGLPLTLSQLYQKQSQEERQSATIQTNSSSFQDQMNEQVLNRDYNMDQAYSQYAQQLAIERMGLWEDTTQFLLGQHGLVSQQQQHDPLVSTAAEALLMLHGPHFRHL